MDSQRVPRKRVPIAKLVFAFWKNTCTACVRASGSKLHGQTKDDWLWKGRRVKIADGTTVIMPDTEANQAEYPQPDGQKPGLGFPMIRMVVLFCLATGAVLDAAIAAYSGKGTGELSLFALDLERVAARARCCWPTGCTARGSR